MKKCTAKTKKSILIIACVMAFLLLLTAVFFIALQIGRAGLAGGYVKGTDYKTITRGNRVYHYKEDMINILCLGIDKEEVMWERDNEGNSIGQSDAIFLASIDPSEKKVKLIAVPRDTIVTLDMYDSNGNYLGQRPGQITLQYAYADGMGHSAELTARRVSEIFNNIPISGYAAINLSCIGYLNDAIGGVDMVMDDDYTDIHPTFKKGETVHLEGVFAELYVTGRDIQKSQTAYTRLFRQKRYLSAFFEQAKVALKKDPMLVVDVLKQQQAYTQISLTSNEILYLTTELLDCRFDDSSMKILPGQIRKGAKYEEYYLDNDAVLDLLVKTYYE